MKKTTGPEVKLYCDNFSTADLKKTSPIVTGVHHRLFSILADKGVDKWEGLGGLNLPSVKGNSTISAYRNRSLGSEHGGRV